MKHSLNELRAYREFAFAPNIVTLCSLSALQLELALRTELLPVFATTLPEYPVATYISEANMRGIETLSCLPIQATSTQITLELPRLWLAGASDGVNVYGMSAVSTDQLKEIREGLDGLGHQLSAFPIPQGLVI